MPIKKEIIYPIFLECCQYAKDAFWENIFEELAYGVCPYGTYISKDYICCSYKGKEFSYKIERKDPQILYNDLYALFNTKLGILSQKERSKRKLDFHETEQSIKESRQKWTDIRKKNIKDLLIERYIIKLREKHSFSIKQAKYLLSIISLAILFKVITVKDIVYENDEIVKIEGINVVNGKISLKHNIYNIMPSASPKVTTTTKRFSDNWEKYLKQLDKNER